MKLPKNLARISKTIRPLSDRVLVKRFEYEHPTLEVVGVKLEKGVVVAVGPGKRAKRKVRFDLKEGHLSTQDSLWFEDGAETGKIHPMPVKVGDVVEFSPRNQIEDEIQGEKLVWVRSSACYGTSNDSRSSALLWQRSAGYDRDGNFLPDAGV